MLSVASLAPPYFSTLSHKQHDFQKQKFNSKEQVPSWEANRSSASQKITRILRNPKVHYRIHNSLPPAPILSQIDPVHAFHPTSLRSILILSSNLLQSVLSPLLLLGTMTDSFHF